MLTLDKLTFRYSRKKLLYNELSLTLETGRIYGLLGKNGAGKSTLLKIMSGLLFPTSGRVSANGFEPRKRQPSFLQTIYLIPEEVYVPAISVQKYLALYAPLYPLFDQNAFNNYLSILNVKITGKLNTFSFGQQKKFIIAFALACNTRILLLDEPTNGLDIPSKIRFRKLIAAAMNSERMIFISTHQVRDLDNLIDNVIIVDNGKLALSSSIRDIGAALSFKTVDVVPQNVLYSEPTLYGTSVITRNMADEETKVNLEQLFNAVTESPEISRLFKNN